MEEVAQVVELRRGVKMKPLQGAVLDDAERDPAAFAAKLPRTAEFLKRNENVAVVVNVESRRAIDNLDAMLAVPGVDAVLVGPHDLSCNLGVPEDFESPIFQSALREIFGIARERGVGAGIHQGMPPSTPGMTPAFAKAWLAAGCNVYVHAADVNLFSDALARDLATIRGDKPNGAAGTKRKREGAIVI